MLESARELNGIGRVGGFQREDGVEIDVKLNAVEKHECRVVFFFNLNFVLFILRM